MNQILDYNPNKTPRGSSSGSDKIVRVFAIILAIFAICLLIAGAYGVYKNNVKPDIPTQAVSQAQISIEQKETVATVNVKHDKVIEKLIYNWDSEKETTIKGSGESVMTTDIPLFAGEHTLNVKVIDVDGNETTFEQKITSEAGEDKIYPVIKLDVTDEKKLRITATDETAMDFVTYRWNDEEEQRVDVSDDDKKIEFEIEILKGNNDLTIVAVDKNSNNTTEIKPFSGVTKPDIKITISADKTKADVYCFHENGIKEIKVKINDNPEQKVGLPEGETPKEATFTLELPQGNANISVTASSVDETETVATETVENEEQNNDVIDISVEKSQEDETKARMEINCEAGIKEIKLNLNDVDIPIKLSRTDAPNAQLDIPLAEGNNKMIVKVISVNGTEKEETKEIFR